MAKREETAMERIMKQVIKGLVTLLIFVILLVLVIMPLMQDKFGISLFGGTVNSVDDIEVVDSIITANIYEEVGYLVSVKSTVRNKTDRDMTKATLKFSLYDESGNDVGTAVAVVEHLVAGNIIEIEATPMSPVTTKPTTCKLTDAMVIR